MKITPCIIGLGYVGLPIALKLAKSFVTYGFDKNRRRIENLKNKIDVNREFEPKKFDNIKKIIFTKKIKDIKKCNFFILCLPTPIHKNKKPDLTNLNDAFKIVSKILKKNDIIFCFYCYNFCNIFKCVFFISRIYSFRTVTNKKIFIII